MRMYKCVMCIQVHTYLVPYAHKNKNKNIHCLYIAQKIVYNYWLFSQLFQASRMFV